MKTINEWKDYFSKSKYSKKDIETLLNNALQKIEFLESIYMTGGKNNHYSDEFRNCAHQEREALCQETSACYSLLREV